MKPKENQELESVEGIFPEKMRNNETENEIDKLKKWEEKIKRKDLKYETKKYIYGFQQFGKIRSFGDNICTVRINIDEAEIDQINLLENMIKFNDKSRPKKRKKKIRMKKKYLCKCKCSL